LLLSRRYIAHNLEHACVLPDTDCSNGAHKKHKSHTLPTAAALPIPHLQLACVEHFRSQPLSCLTTAATSGSRAALAKAVAALPHHQLTRCCQALLAHPSTAIAEDGSSRNELPSGSGSSSKRSPAGKAQQNAAGTAAGTAAALEQLQAFLHPAGGKQQRADKAAAAAAAAGVLEEAVWAAMQSFGRWSLGVLLLHMLAEFTGAALACAVSVLL
jgi:hypothetical protein